MTILESMVHMGPPPNVIHFNAAISACEASGYWEGALDVAAPTWKQLASYNLVWVRIGMPQNAWPRHSDWTHGLVTDRFVATSFGLPPDQYAIVHKNKETWRERWREREREGSMQYYVLWNIFLLIFVCLLFFRVYYLNKWPF